VSILTANSLLVAPPAAIGLAVPSGTNAFDYGAWVEFIASAAGNLAIAGLSIAAGVFSNSDAEYQIGVGTAGNEIGIGTIRFFLGNSGTNCTPEAIMLPIPMGGIVTGNRVSIRTRRDASVEATTLVSLMYYQALDSDQVTNLTQVWTCVPFGAAGVVVTPANSAFTNSNWFELTSGLATTAGIIGLSSERTVTDIDAEYDIGIGTAGNEVVITTIRSGWNGAAAKVLFEYLPSIYFVPASTRIAVRIRKTGTSVTTFNSTLLYIAGVTSGGGNAGRGIGKGKGGGGVNLYVPGGACYMNIGNPGVGVGSGG
jgi:hypothetical protein